MKKLFVFIFIFFIFLNSKQSSLIGQNLSGSDIQFLKDIDRQIKFYSTSLPKFTIEKLKVVYKQTNDCSLKAGILYASSKIKNRDISEIREWVREIVKSEKSPRVRHYAYNLLLSLKSKQDTLEVENYIHTQHNNKKWKVDRLNINGIEMVKFPAGSFFMGAAKNDTNAFPIERFRKLIYLDEFYVSKKMITLTNIYNLLNTNSKLNIDTLELKRLSCRSIDIEKNKKDPTKNFYYITIKVPSKNSKIPPVGKYPKILNEGLGYPPNYLVENSGLAFSPNILSKDTIATGLSWPDIEKIVKAIHKKARVISEAEWEYLFRSDSTSIYPWGNQKIPDDSIIVYLEKKANDIGVHFDPAYFEWCNGWYNRDYYQKEVVENPPGSEVGDQRILKSAGKMRCSAKYLLGYREYAKMISYIGFRVVLPVLQYKKVN